MKKTLLFLLGFFGFFASRAAHITGGEMIYNFVSATATSKTYNITLLLFRDENCPPPCAAMPANVWIGIYNLDTRSLFGGNANGIYDVNLNRTASVPIVNVPTCISNPPTLNYTVGYYTFTVTLPNNSNGYTISYQTCCRIDGISNISNQTGATYTCTIPGTNQLAASEHNSNARFNQGISIACYNLPFTLDFSATDPDGDQLVYSFCYAYNGGTAQNSANIVPDAPAYGSVFYTNGFNGGNPLGNQASINSSTGIISGIAPDAGKYVVSVCVSEFRNGVLIGGARKDFIVTIAPCDLPKALLKTPYYISCDGYTLSFANLSSSPLNNSSYWDFGDPASGANNTSTLQSPSHTFSDTGTFIIKLVVNRGSECPDSATAPVRVYPGFRPGFKDNSPMCKDKPVQFTDTTYARYGVVDYWHWDFGVSGVTNDTSNIRNPTYTFSQVNTYDVTLIVATSKGCTDTITHPVSIYDKPSFSGNNDTLICSVDTIRLQTIAGSPGSVTWTPNYNISNTGVFNPLVSPDVTTTYIATFSDNFGCTANDSITVNVVDTVTLSMPRDTSICRSDTVLLRPNSNGLHYTWTPAATLNDPNIKNPVALPTAAVTTYYVVSRIGKCTDRDSIRIKTVPYPTANATGSGRYCAGVSIPLQATGGIQYAWVPATYLNDAFIPNPTAMTPGNSITYIVYAWDTLGCPKPGKDTVPIEIVHIEANAGPRDTSIVVGQPLQLNGTGGSLYTWSPSRWLNNNSIANPIALPEDDIDYVLEVSDVIGCSDFDTISVHVFRVVPGFYVPTAFSPNGDGLNDIFKPIALGMKSIENFQIFNRWGESLYQTKRIGDGWDGTYKGRGQAPATYVWYAEGTDYKNQKISRKGSVVLIR
jgi:gliding motility-associated-like protein